MKVKPFILKLKHFSYIRTLWLFFLREAQYRDKLENLDKNKRKTYDNILILTFIGFILPTFLLMTPLLLLVPIALSGPVVIIFAGITCVLLFIAIYSLPTALFKTMSNNTPFGIIAKIFITIALVIVMSGVIPSIQIDTADAVSDITHLLQRGILAAGKFVFIILYSVLALLVLLLFLFAITIPFSVSFTAGNKRIAKTVTISVFAAIAIQGLLLAKTPTIIGSIIFASANFAIACLLGYFRLVIFAITALDTDSLLTKLNSQPEHSARFLRKSLAYRDETMRLTPPGFSQLIEEAGKNDRDATRIACIYLTRNTYHRSAARRAWLNLTITALSNCQTPKNIAACLLDIKTWTAISQDVEPPKSIIGKLFKLLRNKFESLDDTKKDLKKGIAYCEEICSEVSASMVAVSNYHKLYALHRAYKRLIEMLQRFRVSESQPSTSNNERLLSTREQFHRIANQWLKIVNGEIDRLTKEEGVTKNVYNPYMAPNPLAPGSEMFVGRADAFRFIEEQFLREGETVPIVLYGQPRVGKSSLLMNLNQHLTTNLIPIYAEMLALGQVETTGGLLFNLAKTIGQQLVLRGVHVKQPSLDAFASEPFIVFDNFLDEVERDIRAPRNRIILALDEFEQIEKQLAAGKVSSDLMDYLRGMMQNRSGIRMIFAGTHTLDEMVSGLWTQYFSSALSCHIGYLDEDSARSLITNSIKEFPLNYEPEAVDLLIKQTHCHPCLIQLTCSVLVDLKNAQRSRHASVADVKQAFDKVLKEAGRNVFPGIWGWIPPGEQKLLTVLASKEPATITQLARALAMQTYEVSAMVERLVENEVLTRNEEGCRFQVALLRQWVVRHAARLGADFAELREAALQS